MDVYSFGVTTYTVSPVLHARRDLVLTRRLSDTYRYSRPSFHSPPDQKAEESWRSWRMATY
jgi:hypothetical protein